MSKARSGSKKAKAKKGAKMANTGNSKTNKKLEALRRAQKIDEILMIGNVQSQAASDSAAEDQPTGQDHIIDLLEKKRMASKSASALEKATSAKKKPRR
ncbi:Uncharacterised protein [uncultured archaeon]|nr:Uncharacterised protein [uncultured archaeon]